MMKKVLFALIALFSFVSTWAEDAPEVNLDPITQVKVDDYIVTFETSRFVALFDTEAGVTAPVISSITKGEDDVVFDEDDVLIFEENEEDPYGDPVPFTEETITEEGKYFLVVPFEEANYNKLLYVPFYVIEPWEKGEYGWTRVNDQESFNQAFWDEDGAYYQYYEKYPWCDVWYQTGQNEEDGVILYPGNTINPDNGEVDRSYYIYGDNNLSDEEKDAAAKEWADGILDGENVYHSWYATQQSNPDNIVFKFAPTLMARVVNHDPWDFDDDNVYNGNGTCRVVSVYDGVYQMPWGANVVFGAKDGAKHYGLMTVDEAKAPSTDDFDESLFAMLLVPSQDFGRVEEVVDFSKSVEVVVFDDVPYNGQNTAAEVYSVTWTAEDDAKDEEGNSITEGDVLAPDQYYIAGYLQAEDVDDNGEYVWGDIKEYPSHVGQWRALVAYGADVPEVGECANDGSIWNYGEDGMMYVGYAVSNEFTVNPAPLEMRLSQITPHFGQKNIKAKYAVKPEYYKPGDDDTNVIIINEEYKGETVNGKYGETAEWYYGDDFGKWWNDPKFNKFDKVNGAAAFDITDADRYSTLGVSVSEYTINSALAHPCTVIDGKVYENYYIAAVTDAQCRIIANKVTITVPGEIGKIYGDEDPDLNWGITVIDEAGQDMTADDYSYDADDEDRQDNPKVTVVISREVATDGSNIENVGKYKIYVDLMGSDAKNYEVKAKTSKAIKEGGVTVGYRYEYEQAFEIWQRDLDDPNVIIDIADYKYNGKNQQVEPKEDKGVLFYDEFNVFKDADDNYADGYSADNYYVDADGKGYVILKKDIDWVIADGGAQKEAADAAVGAYWNNNKVQRKADGTVDTKKGICDIEAVFEGAGADKTYTRNFFDRKAGNFTITPLTLVLKVKDAETAFGSTPTYELEVVTTDARNEGFITDPEETFTTADVQLVAPNVVFSGYTAGDDAKDEAYEITAALKSDVNRVEVSRNYEPIFENGELTVNPLALTVASRDQNGYYKSMYGDVEKDPTDDTDKAFMHDGKNYNLTYVRPDIDHTPRLADDPETAEVEEATVDLVSGTLPAGVTIDQLVQLKRTTTKVASTTNYITIEGKDGVDLSNYNITFQSTGNFNIDKLPEIHLAYKGDLGQALEDHKGQTDIDVFLPYRGLFENIWTSFVLPFELNVPELSHKLYYGLVNTLNTEVNDGDVHFIQQAGNIDPNTPFLFKIGVKKNWNNGSDENKAMYPQNKVQYMADDPSTPDVDESELRAVGMYPWYVASQYFEGVTIQDCTVEAGETGYFTYNDNATAPRNTVGNNSFIGVYNTYTANEGGDQGDWFLGPNGKFYGGANNVDKPVAAISAFVNKPVVAGITPRFFFDEGGVVTAIEGILDSAVSEAGEGADAAANGFAEGWYTINGIKLEGEPTTTGTYIYNGKKVFIQK